MAARRARGEDGRLAGAVVPGYELLATGRDSLGLYALTSLAGQERLDAREALGAFWRAQFGWLLGAWDAAAPRAAMEELAAEQPRLAAALGRGLASLGAALSRLGRQGAVPGAAFVSSFAPAVRPLAGFLERLLQNADGERAARLRCLALLERTASLVPRP